MTSDSPPPWPADIFNVLKRYGVSVVGYVPDAGHTDLIKRVHSDNDMRAVLLTTEEEGIGLLAGAWLGNKRGVLLMQSSGVGNCINMLSLSKLTRFPFFTIVTMRGEFGEFNPWQVPMGSTTPEALRLMDVQVLRADVPDEVGEVVENGARFAYEGGTATAVLLSQRLLGAKSFAK
jgi:sulfopyruvate decarboxylase alpha subunit